MPEYDEIGIWSEIKLGIIKDYASAYSRILSAQTNPKLRHVYIDAFAGSGQHVSKATREIVPGSPINALSIAPKFEEYFLIDLDGDKVASLRKSVGGREDVRLFTGDCNQILHTEVFPKVRYENFRRGLCLLDPYGLHLEWSVICEAGQMGSLEIFLNFPMMDMNRNVLWHKPDQVSADEALRMTRFWGDETWRSAAYEEGETLFGDTYLYKKTNHAVADAFRKRLVTHGNFEYVPAPIPMRNSQGATVYYLFFASQKGVAKGIVESIFGKYREVGLRR